MAVDINFFCICSFHCSFVVVVVFFCFFFYWFLLMLLVCLLVRLFFLLLIKGLEKLNNSKFKREKVYLKT